MKIIKKIFSALALITVCAMLAGCQKFEFNGRSGRKIGFNVSSTDTKASAMTTAGLQTAAQFGLIAVNDKSYVDNSTGTTYSAGKYFESIVKYSSGNWDTYDSTGSSQTDFMWINGQSMHFWSYYPLDADVDSAAEGIRTITSPSALSESLTFTYSQPALTTTFVDATKQKDLIFAGNKETRTFDKDGDITDTSSSNTSYSPTTDKNDVDIRFYHALSEIRFCVSTDDGSLDSGLKITKIAIDAAGSGSCQFTLPSTFEWSDLSDWRTFSQTCGTLPSTTNSEWKVGKYTHSTLGEKILYTNLNSFFMIPSTDLSSVSIEVTFLLPDNTTYVTKNFDLTSSSGEEWEAGKYYNYKIGAHLSTSLTMSLSLLDWDYMEKAYDYTASPTCTDEAGKLKMTNESPAGSKTVVADTPVEAKFTLDTPIGATWLVSVTNTDAFEVYTLDGTGTENPAYGTIQNDSVGTPAPCTFYIKAKPGIDRSTVLSTKIHITVRLVDGTYVNVDDLLGVSGWNIILNPLS